MYVWVVNFWMVMLSIWQPALCNEYIRMGVPMYQCMYLANGIATLSPGMCSEPMPKWVWNRQ